CVVLLGKSKDRQCAEHTRGVPDVDFRLYRDLGCSVFATSERRQTGSLRHRQHKRSSFGAHAHPPIDSSSRSMLVVPSLTAQTTTVIHRGNSGYPRSPATVHTHRASRQCCLPHTKHTITQEMDQRWAWL